MSEIAGARFGVFEANFQTGELRRQGFQVRISRQPFLLLKALLLSGGRILSHSEIQGVLWPSEIVCNVDHRIKTTLMNLRRILHDVGKWSRWIETLPGFGIRFMADVRFIEPSYPTSPTCDRLKE